MTSARPHRLAGFTLAELLASAAAGGLVLAGFAALLGAHARTARAQVERTRVAEALRVPALVLPAELALLDPETDLGFVGPGAAGLRAFRGSAVACGSLPDGRLVVRYRGLRRPEPDKDSVLVVGVDGERVLPLLSTAAATEPCRAEAGEEALAWRLPGPPPEGAVLLLFESGSYHLEDRAFRYRIGSAGRQPLTESLLDTRQSGFAGAGGVAAGPAMVEVALTAQHTQGSIVLRRARLRIPLLNARAGAPR